MIKSFPCNAVLAVPLALGSAGCGQNPGDFDVATACDTPKNSDTLNHPSEAMIEVQHPTHHQKANKKTMGKRVTR
jgi:hypothetical protein